MASARLPVNVDYLFLFESGLLCAAAIGAAAVGRTDRPWRSLALFSAVRAVADWFNIAAVDAHVTGFLALAETLFLVVGTVALFEFAGRDDFLRRRGTRLIIYGSAGMAAAWCAATGGKYFAVALFVASLVGATWASVQLWLRGRAGRGWSSFRFCASAFALTPFVALSGLPRGLGSIGWSLPIDGWLLDVAGLLFAAVFSLALYIECAVVQQRGLDVDVARHWRRRRYLCWAVVNALVVAGFIFADAVGKAKDLAMRDQILLRTKIAAAAVNADLVRALKWGDADLNSPAYAQLKGLVTAMRSANPDLRFALLSGLDQRRTYFLSDSESPTSPDYSPPGQFYEEADPRYIEFMVQRRSFTFGPFTDRWGTWVIGSTPIVELGLGRGVNFELDISAEHWAAEIRRARLPVVFIVLLICLIIIGSFQAQERLREGSRRITMARDTAEAATRAKSEFLAVMSHELRTPLAGVISMIDLLRRSPPAELGRRYAEVAGDSAQTLLHILDDILDMAKVEAGKLRLEAIPFRPREEFKFIGDAARLRAEAKRLDFAYEMDASVPEVLVGDPTRLRQVIGNLQNNALKFTKSGGVFVTISAAPHDEQTVLFRIAVRDTGAGIDEATQKRLFQKFEQADVSTTRRYGGTGLGLSIVKALADAMYGSVAVESELGRGSTFVFTTPLGIGSVEAIPPPAEMADIRPVQPLRILCAEDEPVNRLVAEELLRQVGQSVEFAENGSLAVARLRQAHFDLVLMDGRMPVMNGLQATDLIRDRASGVLDPDVYICALTANASETDRQECLAHGMNDYLTKPLTLVPLVAALRRAADYVAAHPHAAGTLQDRSPMGLSEAELLAVLDEQAETLPSSSEFPVDVVERLTEIFLRETPRQIVALRDACGREDAAAIGGIAHALKSAGHYVEAHRLSKIAAELEKEAESAAFAVMREGIEQLDAEFVAFEKSVRARSRVSL